MKQSFKYKLSDLGLLPKVDAIRRIPEIIDWIIKGCTKQAPAPVKRMILSAYCQKYGLKEFVETGTFMGDTLAHMAQNKALKCTSIEIADSLFHKAKERFNSYLNITLLHGDSGQLLPQYVKQLQQPALFWLDGHYSGGVTGKGNDDTPISTELAAIIDSPIKQHVILIDDARCFVGENSYPHIDELLKIAREQSNYEIEISADIIRLTPKK
ncbi:MAG: hypothetical protein AAF572_08430 [Cyanobacteria bacterium P01_B01_bin.77]